MKDAHAKILERLVNGPPKPKPIRYAIYTRQSVEKLADFSSCEAQFHTCRDFVSAFNDPRLHWCGQRFDDEGQPEAIIPEGAIALPTRKSAPPLTARQRRREIIDLLASHARGSLPCMRQDGFEPWHRSSVAARPLLGPWKQIIEQRRRHGRRCAAEFGCEAGDVLVLVLVKRLIELAERLDTLIESAHGLAESGLQQR